MRLFSLARANIKKSLKDYSIYFLTLVIAVAIFYIFNSIDSQTAMMTLSESKMQIINSIVVTLKYLSVFVAIVLGFLIVYANNFLIKRRKKEIGLYFTLGMSRKDISLILMAETTIVGIVSLVVGLILGIGLSQVISIFTAKLFEADMTRFSFVFSFDCLVYVIINFSIIFLIVMVFNLFALGRFKLIDLLYANRKNEQVRIKKSWLITMVFILALFLIGYAYKLLYDGALYVVGNQFMIMLISGAVGTFLFFLSIAGFLLKVVEMSKKVYYRGLNMFVLKQVNHKINTSVTSTTVISLMLLLTIGILSSSLSMSKMMNNTLSSNSPCDFTLFSNGKAHINKLIQMPQYQELVKADYCVDVYHLEGVYQGNFISSKNALHPNMEIIKEQPIEVIRLSDYNNVLRLEGKEVVTLANNQYLFICNLPMAMEYYDEFLAQDNAVEFGTTTLTSQSNHVIEDAIFNGNGNGGLIVVSDEIITNSVIKQQYYQLVGNYYGNDESKFINLIDYYNEQNNGKYLIETTKNQLQQLAVGNKALCTFVGLYLGIVFAISSGTILAIEQLSQIADNKERYHILGQLGADKPMINRSLWYQIGISFMVPLAVALVHSFVGLQEVNKIISSMAQVNIATDILATSIFIVVVYGGYYVATYLACNRIINED